MTASTDFLAFACGAGANVTSQSAWSALPALGSGFQTGVAQSAQVNKALRQGTFGVAGVATFIADTLSINVPDDGNLSNFVTNLTAAIQAAALEVCGTVSSVAVTGTAGQLVVTGSPITTTGTIALSLATTGVGAGTYTGASLTIDAYGRITAATAISSTGGSGTIVPNGAGDSAGTIASSGWAREASGRYRVWAVIQCQDGGNGTYIPSTIPLASILPTGAVVNGIIGVAPCNLSVLTGQNSNAARAVLSLMSVSTSQVVVTLQNTDQTGTLASFLVEISTR